MHEQGCSVPAVASLHSLHRCNPHSLPSLERPRHKPDGTTHRSHRHTAPSPPARDEMSGTEHVTKADRQPQLLERKHLTNPLGSAQTKSSGHKTDALAALQCCF